MQNYPNIDKHLRFRSPEDETDDPGEDRSDDPQEQEEHSDTGQNGQDWRAMWRRVGVAGAALF